MNRDEFDDVVVADAMNLLITHDVGVSCAGGPGSSTTFRSTTAGFACDNPTDPSAFPAPFSFPFVLPWKNRLSLAGTSSGPCRAPTATSARATRPSRNTFPSTNPSGRFDSVSLIDGHERSNVVVCR